MNIFQRLWAALNRIEAPVPISEALSPGPRIAPLSSERYLDVNHKRTAEQDWRHEIVAGRICAINNANVTRDFGTHKVTIKAPAVAGLTEEETADAERFIFQPARSV
jgi:hypothetical protein